MTTPPKVDDAPGLRWRPRKHGWEARWRARSDLVRRGFSPQNVRLWVSSPDMPLPTDAVKAFIADQCKQYQTQMLVWGRGGVQPAADFNGTMRSLIACYQSDPDSTYKKLRFATRQNYDTLCKRLYLGHGDVLISDIKARLVLRWHEGWSGNGVKMTIAHGMVGMVRTLVNFGATILEDDACAAVALILHRMKFPQGKPRSSALSTQQAEAICALAVTMGYPSIAVAQSFQTDGILRQKDVIGEYVPLSDPGISDIIVGNEKSVRGLRWQEIDANLVLHHVTSKRNKMIDIPLAGAPLVMAQFRRILGIAADMPVTRDMLPENGPIVVHDRTGQPWETANFRRHWRKIANAAGVPKHVFNMDSRAGAISEATDAGADLEHVRHAATHGDISMTQRYSRNSTEKVAKVMETRVAYRNRTGTKEP